MTDDPIPESHRDILDAKGFAHVATLTEKQVLQNSPTWYLWDDERKQLLISLTTGRQRYRNLRVNPRVAACIADPENPYRYVEIRGPVDAIVTDEGNELINALAKKYVGKDEYTRHKPGDVRVVVRIVPERVLCFG